MFLVLRSVGRITRFASMFTSSGAAQYELGQSTAIAYNWTALHPAFLRGEAYLAAHQGRRSRRRVPEILDHRGIVLNSAIGVLAHLELAQP